MGTAEELIGAIIERTAEATGHHVNLDTVAREVLKAIDQRRCSLCEHVRRDGDCGRGHDAPKPGTCPDFIPNEITKEVLAHIEAAKGSDETFKSKLKKSGSRAAAGRRAKDKKLRDRTGKGGHAVDTAPNITHVWAGHNYDGTHNKVYIVYIVKDDSSHYEVKALYGKRTDSPLKPHHKGTYNSASAAKSKAVQVFTQKQTGSGYIDIESGAYDGGVTKEEVAEWVRKAEWIRKYESGERAESIPAPAEVTKKCTVCGAEFTVPASFARALCEKCATAATHPTCMGSYEESHSSCKECLVADECKNRTPAAATPEPPAPDPDPSPDEPTDVIAKCVDNEGIEDGFVVGVEYVAVGPLPKGGGMITVYDKFGSERVCEPSRFKKV